MQEKTAMSFANGMPSTLYSDLIIPHSVLSLIPFTLALKYHILPLRIAHNGHLEALIANPHDADVIQTMQMHTGRLIRGHEVDKEQLLKLIDRHYGPYQRWPRGTAARADAVGFRRALLESVVG
jgi:hypothetical protein